MIYLVGSARIFYISLWPQKIQPREWEKKNKQTIWTYVSAKPKKGSLCDDFVQLFVHLVGVYFSRNLYQLLGMPTHLCLSALTASYR